MPDIIIIGRGPAGISAALYTARANIKTLVIGREDSMLRKAEKIENYFGFENPIAGKYLLEVGEKQALRFGTEILDDDVLALKKEDSFQVVTSNGTFTCKAILIASGQPHSKPAIKNLTDFEGKGIAYCTSCDGYFYKNLKVGVIGNKDLAIHEATELLSFTDNVTIFTNGQELDVSEKYRAKMQQFRVNKKSIEGFSGETFLESMIFSDNSAETVDGVFIANKSASGVDFAMNLGIFAENNSIVVDKDQKTNVEGVYAAGDCTGGFKQVSTAVGQGALAGRRLIEYVKSLKV